MNATIAEQVRQLAGAVTGQAPDEVMGVFGKEQADLAVTGNPEGLIEIGAILPDADLLDPHGNRTTFYQSIGGEGTVVVFYRGAWCPYCNIALKTYQTTLAPELARRRVGLAAISPQAPDGSLSMAEKNNLTYAVLSDQGNQLARAAGILTAPSDAVRAAQLQLGLDLTTVNADGTVTLPMPTTIIVDTDHVVRWIDVHPDYSTRSESAQILGAIDAIFTR
jgi:peroxiredoxin